MEPKVGVGVIVLNPSEDTVCHSEDIKFLIGKRISEENHGNDLWSFPGGGLNYLESPEDCAKREVKEEFGIDILYPQKLLPFPYTNDIIEGSKKGQHYITLFLVSIMKPGNIPEIQIENGKKKHSEWQWATPGSIYLDKLNLFHPIGNIISSGIFNKFIENYFYKNIDIIIKDYNLDY